MKGIATCSFRMILELLGINNGIYLRGRRRTIYFAGVGELDPRSSSPIDGVSRRSHLHKVKKPTVIIIDPKKVAEICSKPSNVSREEAIRSILVQNGKNTAKLLVKAR